MIYVVTRGEYSDYRIVGVFTDKAKAEKYADFCCGNVEEYEENPDFPDASWLPGGLDLWRLQWTYRSGRENNHAMKDELQCSRGNNYQFEAIKKLRVFVDWSVCGDYMVRYVLAKDEGHALKIGKDETRQIKAGQKRVFLNPKYFPKKADSDSEYLLIGTILKEVNNDA